MDFNLNDLYTYHHAMNVKLAALLMANEEKVPETATKLFSHILGAQNIWNSRILSITPTIPVWEIQPIAQFENLEEQNHRNTLTILNNRAFSEEIEYVNLQGLRFKNTVGDILFHVANHGNYHRAQIATALKPAGITPLVTDYIAFKRTPL